MKYRAWEPEPQGDACFWPHGARAARRRKKGGGAAPKKIGSRSRKKYAAPVPAPRI